MDYTTFSDDGDDLKYAILIKESSFNLTNINTYYLSPLEQLGINRKHIVVVSISSPEKKLKADTTKKELIKIGKGLKQYNINKILVTHGEIFKFLTGVTKTGNYFGEVVKPVLPEFENTKCILSVDYNALIYNQSLESKLKHSLELFKTLAANNLILDKNVIHKHIIPRTYAEKQQVLKDLFQYSTLSCDIETTGLRFNEDRIVSIAFAWNQHEGTSFMVQEEDLPLLKWFFKQYPNLKFHNALFDCKFLIYHCFMEDSLDLFGLQEGLKAFEQVDDTMLMTYLALNSIHDIELGLKENSYEFAGNYGIEGLYDASLIPEEELLVYNLKDCLATLYVKDKYFATLTKENQWDIYYEIFQPSIKVMLYIMLIGMPMNMVKVSKLKKHLTKIKKEINESLVALNCVKKATAILKQRRCDKDNADRKAKAKNPDKIKIKTLDDISDEVFNFNSSNQLTVLLYEVLELPILNKTAKGNPATDAKTIELLLNHTEDEEIIFLLKQLQELASGEIILSTFISAFERYAFEREDGSIWLNGDKKLGGTQSGRLSSSNPNMENIPSNSKYGKDIKECFEVPEGFLFAGADFSSLEDRINAILTQDTNKVKVYTDGYDGHCLRAFSYFRNEMPDISDTLESINSIEDKYPKIRQRSKQPTFALTYLGTASTLVKNLGLSWEEARQIENSYHELYKESDAWAEKQIKFAHKHGYVNCAFGLRVRTPLLKKTIKTKKHNMHIAEKEERSAVNAITQSWGMLINRTAIEVINKILESPFKFDIFPINTIHDSIYFLVRNKPEAIKFLNDNLIAAMEWNDHPVIKSNDVPMKASLEIGFNWKDLYSLKNSASLKEIEQFLREKKLYAI